MNKLHPWLLLKVSTTCSPSTFSHQSCINKDARKLRTDCFMDKCCSYCGIYTAREATNRSTRTYLMLYVGCLFSMTLAMFHDRRCEIGLTTVRVCLVHVVEILQDGTVTLQMPSDSKVATSACSVEALTVKLSGTVVTQSK